MFGLLNVNMTSYSIIQLFKAAVVTGCFFVLCISCENDMQQVKELGSKKTGIEEVINVETLLSQNGQMRAKLTAPLMLRYQIDTAKIEFPKTLKVDFYDSTGKLESKLFAKYGHYLENINKVFLKDSVVVANNRGDTLKTEELYWDQNQQIFFTDKNVKIVQPDKTIYGTGLRAAQSFKWWTIIKPTGFVVVADSTMPAAY